MFSAEVVSFADFGCGAGRDVVLDVWYSTLRNELFRCLLENLPEGTLPLERVGGGRESGKLCLSKCCKSSPISFGKVDVNSVSSVGGGQVCFQLNNDWEMVGVIIIGI